MTYASAFDVLADPTRRNVFERLRGGPRSVTELAAGLPVSRPAVSQHLKVLADAQLVRAEKRGRHRYYTIDPRGLGSLRDYVSSLWDDVLDAYALAAERLAHEEEQRDGSERGS